MRKRTRQILQRLPRTRLAEKRKSSGQSGRIGQTGRNLLKQVKQKTLEKKSFSPR